MPNAIFEIPKPIIQKHLPDEFRLPPDGQPSQIRVLLYGGTEVRQKQVETIEEVERFLNKAPVVWIDIEGLGTFEVLVWLQKKFNLHPVHLNTALQHNLYPNHEYVSHYQIDVYPQYLVDTTIHIENFTIWKGTNFVLTMHNRPVAAVQKAEEIILNNKYESQQKGKDYLHYLLVVISIQAYQDVAEYYRSELLSLENNFFGTKLLTFQKIYQQVHLLDNEFSWYVGSGRMGLPLDDIMEVYWDDTEAQYSAMRQNISTLKIWTEILLQTHEQNIRTRQLFFLQIIAGLLGIFLPLIILAILIF